MEKLIAIQSELKAPKNQYNSFGKYKYRNCEDILEALKPLLKKHACTLTISDDITEIGGVLVCEARATISDGKSSLTVAASAGIDTQRKGMDIAQSFGASSSYARKYALNGLFLIDDTKDPDHSNKHEEKPEEIDPTILEQINLMNSKEELGNYFRQLQKNKLLTEAVKKAFTDKAATL